VPTIAIQNGKIVFRESKAATDTECCCGCCCIDGDPDPTKTTRTQCEDAGGVWNSGERCGDPCFCCSGVYDLFLCQEQVISHYPVVWTEGGNADPMTPETIPVEQPPGTVFVNGSQGGCVGTAGLLQDHINFPGASCWNSTDPLRTPGAAAARTQWYYRYRLVNDCAECVTDIDEDVLGDCDTGTIAIACVPFTKAVCSEYSECVEAAGVDPCNPLP